ncbi:MAG TPA: cupin domain-containing protein [Candidatus Anaerobiospirillum pullistercoris]|uniref:Cupin domain-containing protein n=1 Tax=Candidatus Anaerobiospirillum pullistercoris TaxID=2838452 RepID=A0A9D1WEU3_9GAMM|nr:cupin domain-containing protein [Candidatus Anaerobiospirillum pullistercoris]
MSNFAKLSLAADAPRAELHDALKLTGCEVSFNNLPAGVAVPFVHKHKENEELYLIVKGSGEFFLDGEIITLAAGDCVRVDPACERCIKAGNEGLSFYCIQTKAGSLEHFTTTDGVACETKAFA